MSAAPAPVQVKVAAPKAWAKPFVMPEAKPQSPIYESPTAQKTFEAVGEWIQKSLWANQQKQKVESKANSPSGSPTAGSPTDGNFSRDRVKAGSAKLKDEDYEVDYYEKLALDESTVHLMSQDALMQHYRKRCIETHPDKMPDQSDKLYLAVQRGYQILSNEASRRAYDSSRPFDDSIPRDVAPESDEEYYSTYAPVFDRNIRFSMDQPMPTIGDAETPMADVKKFYDAWYRFRSWRDFSFEMQKELERVDEGMDRYTKRENMRTNERILAKRAKEEMTRLRELVDRANKYDPRIIKQREEEKAKLEAAKIARDAERNAKRDAQEREKREAAEREKREAAEKILKAKGEKEALKELRLSLMAFFTDNELLDNSPSLALRENEVCQKVINWLSQKSNAEQISNLMSEITTKSVEEADGKVEAVVFFNQCVKQCEQDNGQTRYGEACKSTRQIQKEKEEAERKAEMAKPMKDRKPGFETWEEKVTEALVFGVAKNPEGTADRTKKLHASLPDAKLYNDDQLMIKVKEIEAQFEKDPKSKPVAPDMSVLARLTRLLEKYASGKVAMAPAMIAKYAEKNGAGKEEEMMAALVKKLGKEPVAEWTIPGKQ